MDLGDICDADFYERKAHFKSQMCNISSTPEETVWAEEYAHKEATAEILSEIHVMLFELLKRSNP